MKDMDSDEDALVEEIMDALADEARRPAAASGGATWESFIDVHGDLPATLLQEIRNARRAYPPRKIIFQPYKTNRNPAIHRGYTQSRNDGGAHQKWSIAWVDHRVLRGATGLRKLAGEGFKKLFEREGSTADLNMYDNQIVTWGTGFGGMGSLQSVLERLEPTRVGQILRDCGLRWDRKRKRYHIVDLRTSRVVSSGARGSEEKRHRPPLESMRQQDDFLYVLIGLSLAPATREIVIQAMWDQYLAMAASFRGAEHIYTQALFNFISHMHLWLPKPAQGGALWAYHKIGPGAPSENRDRQLAVYFARYFTKAAFVLDRHRAARGLPAKNYGNEVVSRLPGRPWRQLAADDRELRLPPLRVEDGVPPEYPSDSEVTRYWNKP
jgi:hypothetical protein